MWLLFGDEYVPCTEQDMVCCSWCFWGNREWSVGTGKERWALEPMAVRLSAGEWILRAETKKQVPPPSCFHSPSFVPICRASLEVRWLMCRTFHESLNPIQEKMIIYGGLADERKLVKKQSQHKSRNWN